MTSMYDRWDGLCRIELSLAILALIALIDHCMRQINRILKTLNNLIYKSSINYINGS